MSRLKERKNFFYKLKNKFRDSDKTDIYLKNYIKNNKNDDDLIKKLISRPWFSVAIVFICLILIFICYKKVIKETKESTVEAADNICEIYMHDTATLMEGYFQTALSSFFHEMRSAYEAYIISKPNKKSDLNVFFNYLMLGNHREYYAFIDDKGYLYTEKGIDKSGIYLSFYNKIKAGNNRIITISDDDTKILGIESDSTIIIATAVEHYIIDDTTIVGIISAVDVEYLCDRMNMKATNKDSFYAASVIKTNGDYVIHNSPYKQTEKYSNYFVAFEENATTERDEGSIKIKADMIMRRSGFSTLSVFGEKSYLYYMPIKYTDLYIVVYMPYQVMERTISNLNKNNTDEFIKLSFVGVIVLLFCWSIYFLQVKNDKKHVIKAMNLIDEARMEANNANKAKSDFLSHISHDIRTPLNGIIGMTDIAISGDDYSKRVKECLQDIAISSDYLLTLINDVLDMTKIESGKMDIKESDFCINNLNDECFEIVKSLCTPKKIKLKYINLEKNINIKSDKIKLKQILMNVLNNAVKYTENEGEILFKCEVIENEDKILLKYVVQDNGIGMEKDFLNKIFDPFEQEKNDYQTKYMGSGLGMSIVKNLISLLGGNIYIDTDLGIGTTVFLEFNLPSSKMVNNTITDINNNVDKTTLKVKKVLVVEDNEMNLKIATHLIKSIGNFIVDTACDGITAIKMFEKSDINEYSYIFMDIMMPGLDGFETTKIIRNLFRRDAMKIPIIAMTANAFTESVSKSQEVGMTEYITKPIDKNILKQVIIKYLQD